MAEFFSPEEAEILLDRLQLQDAPPFNEEQWAYLAFVDPLSLVPKFSTASNYGETVSDNELTALYADWQTRESEIGYALVERRRRELQAAIDCYQAALERRQRTVSFARARLQTIQRINATEPDQSLHYPQEQIAWLENEIRVSESEGCYLRLYTSRMAALANVIKSLQGSGQSELVEQYCRLIGNSWRGLMKLRSFEKKFPQLIPKTEPGEGAQAIMAGQIIRQVAAESPLHTDITLSNSTIAYLKHQLRTIALLARRARVLFDPKQQNAHLEGNWPPVMILLAAITEFFYFTNFEMVYSSHGKVVEQIDVAKVWLFNTEIKDWQQFDESSIERLRRHSIEAALLLAESPPFLRCTNVEDISTACQSALPRFTPTALAQAYGPYQCAGLARMEQRTESKTFKFLNASPLIGQVLSQVVATDEALNVTFNSPWGNPMQTLIGMANLEPRAFGLQGGEELLSRNMALKVLGNFWKRMGKQRPVALLGENYAKQIYTGLASIGESAPERSSLLSIHLTNIFNNTLFTAAAGKGPTDLLTVLMLADQIRLMDLLDLSWSYAQAVISDLQTVRTLPEIAALIKSGGTFARYESEIAKRFNEKWLNAKQPLWTILRGAAPHAWGFWSKLATGNSVAQLLSKAEPAQALGFLLLPLADVVRLMLLFETSSPVLAERQKVDAETAARDLLSGFIIFREWPSPLGTIVPENLSYYFDPTVTHDAWLAFTESVKMHLRQLGEDLKTRQASEPIMEMLNTVLDRLEANYPTPQRAQAELPKSGGTGTLELIEIDDCELAESDCQFLHMLCRELFGERGLTHIIFLKALGLWRSRELHAHLHTISSHRKQLRELLDEPSLRAMLLSSPGVVRDVGNLLGEKKSETIDDALAAKLINYLKGQRDYQQQLDAVLALPAIPFDEDRQRILELTVKTNGEYSDLLIMALGNTPTFIAVNEAGAAAALVRFESELRIRAQRQFPDWQPEPLLLGAVTLCASHAGLALSNSRLEIDPIFQEPDKPSSARTLWTFASNKMGLALRQLQAELTDSIIAIRL